MGDFMKTALMHFLTAVIARTAASAGATTYCIDSVAGQGSQLEGTYKRDDQTPRLPVFRAAQPTLMERTGINEYFALPVCNRL